MSGTTLKPVVSRPIEYPETDGQPMAENTLQFRWIVTIQGGLDALFANEPMVFVAGDLFWYPVEGDPSTRLAPDVMVVLGRPKGHRGSYRQWDEGGVAPQVVFEVLSPGNRYGEMQRKFDFYQHFGVEEYYVYDPDSGELLGWLRNQDRLVPIPKMDGWVSPRLGVTFALDGVDLQLRGKDGRLFVSYVELASQREEAEQKRMEEEAKRKEEEAKRKEAETKRRQAEDSVEALRAQLRALGVEPQR